MHNNEWTSGPANYALVKFLITSLELSASSDRFFTSSYISFLYLEKFKIHELFSTHLVFRKDGGKTCLEPMTVILTFELLLCFPIEIRGIVKIIQDEGFKM